MITNLRINKISSGKFKLWIILTAVLALASCGNKKSFKENSTGRIKNIILLIGDGMGPQQIGLVDLYSRYSKNPKVVGKKLALTKMMNEGAIGLMAVEPYGGLVADSAVSATQLASGVYAPSQSIGVDQNNKPVETILHKAKSAGKSVGVVTDTRLTHATPAAFIAHQLYRDFENEIAIDMLDVAPDVMLGGGLRNFIPQTSNEKSSETYINLRKVVPDSIALDSKRTDELDLLEVARNKGYKTVFTRKDLESAKNGKLFGLFASSSMPDAIKVNRDRDNASRTIPTLQEMTSKALEILSQDPDGFFLMVEGGQIDWAGHTNDAGWLLHEMLNFDLLLKEVLAWAADRNDTLVVVTADHETGSFGLSYSRDGKKQNVINGKVVGEKFNFVSPDDLDKMYQQDIVLYELVENFKSLPIVEKTPERLASEINKHTTLHILPSETKQFFVVGKPDDEFAQSANDIPLHDVARFIAKHQNVVWATGTHTSTPVTVVAYGPVSAASKFKGWHHSTEIGRIMLQALDLPLSK